jgi:hypothetical protein
MLEGVVGASQKEVDVLGYAVDPNVRRQCLDKMKFP